MKMLSHASAGKKKDKNSQKFQISQFYWLFSDACDVMAVKGLIPEVGYRIIQNFVTHLLKTQRCERFHLLSLCVY